ncbi:cationic amino acid transporter 2, vacuolar-like [Arachis ipaensis]|uniref:cationic amino acid transporter 2, vacuolar-like n=1 Tax=Arachis ipaensis TaxID=130454 RepID=UPI000A2B16BA|nr:cationic amino acid transporter 2, vacuolar-like [Arachis ipaensis]
MGSFKFFTRRKQVDSVEVETKGLLAKELTVPHLIAIGVGSTIGAGVYVLVGTVAREEAGPALTISFLLAGIAAALSAFCYAELASRCPSAGSAYHYSYICLGEGVAWLIGWALILEYTIGSATVARGITPNLAALIGGADKLPIFLSRQHIPGIDIIVDPCAAILVFIITALLCIGIKEIAVVQGTITSINVCALLFVVTAGSYLGFKFGWVGYDLHNGYFPFGVDGMLAGSATVFFAYIGFDAIASTAEEVKNPQRNLPLGIGGALFLCCGLYMMISIVVVGLVPYYAIDPDTPISSAFAKHGMHWAAYIINAGAFTALCSALMGGILPQPRILMAMARDGLLPPFFSDINKHTQIPVKSTIVTGLGAAILAFFMEVSELAGMASHICVLCCQIMTIYNYFIVIFELLFIYLFLCVDVNNENRRRVAGRMIALTCLGAFVLTYSSSNLSLHSFVRFTLCGVGGITLLSTLAFLSSMEQDDASQNFGHSGGFVCPFVPLLPIVSILINSYLLVNLSMGTWLRVSVWLAGGVLVYAFYGRTHSSLKDVIYVPAIQVDEIYRASKTCLV